MRKPTKQQKKMISPPRVRQGFFLFLTRSKSTRQGARTSRRRLRAFLTALFYGDSTPRRQGFSGARPKSTGRGAVRRCQSHSNETRHHRAVYIRDTPQTRKTACDSVALLYKIRSQSLTRKQIKTFARFGVSRFFRNAYKRWK